PEALGSRSGDRDRVEATLDHRREHQVLGQTLRPEHALDHLGIAARPLYPPLDDGPAVATLEVLQEAPDLGLVPNREKWALRAGWFRSGYVWRVSIRAGGQFHKAPGFGGGRLPRQHVAGSTLGGRQGLLVGPGDLGVAQGQQPENQDAYAAGSILKGHGGS